MSWPTLFCGCKIVIWRQNMASSKVSTLLVPQRTTRKTSKEIWTHCYWRMEMLVGMAVVNTCQNNCLFTFQFRQNSSITTLDLPSIFQFVIHSWYNFQVFKPVDKTSVKKEATRCERGPSSVKGLTLELFSRDIWFVTTQVLRFRVHGDLAADHG